MTSPQLELFPSHAPQEQRPRVHGMDAQALAELSSVAKGLPPELRMGTSSWSFPGWTGLVYSRRYDSSTLSRHGLTAYSAHPLLRTVGVDHSHYQPVEINRWKRYADQVPEDFRFLTKAHRDCTLPLLPGGNQLSERHQGRANPRFLDPSYARDWVVGPHLEGLGSKAGPILFQFAPMDVEALGGSRRFAESLFRFLRDLPSEGRYAVELRNRALLTRDYAEALRHSGVAHCYSLHPSMPALRQQEQVLPLAQNPELVLRWMLHPSLRYQQARERFSPFSALQLPDPEARSSLKRILLESSLEATLIVNNKAEGSSPESIRVLAEALQEAS